MGLADLEQLVVTSRAQWREWLERNAGSSPGVWLVTYKRSTGLPAPSYDDVVEEALCFGWIDSTVRSRDEQTGMQLMTPRRPGSTWSASNKARLERLVPAGKMDPRGLAAVEIAKANGSWQALDQVEAMVVPEDLAAALAADPKAAATFAGYSPSALKQHLWWVISARRSQTRARRVAAVVTAAHEGRRAV